MHLRLLVPILTMACTACGPVLPETGAWSREELSTEHVSTCDSADCGDGSALPVGGKHCSFALYCRKYTEPQKRCAWVHNLEHGHVVLLYNCPEGCPDEVDALTRIWSTRGRTVLAPDNKMPRRFAALVWAHGWHGDTLDLDAVNAVLEHQDIDAPEPGLSCAL
jgi:hypothetical protein